MNKTEINIREIENRITKETILFLDFDGTLVDTDKANYLAYEKAIKSVLNKTIPYNNNERFTREKLNNIFHELTKKQNDEIVKKKELFYEEFLPDTKVNKTICELLNKYSKTNTTILVTNCRKDRALITLNYYNLEKKFSKIFYRQINGTTRINKYKNVINELNFSPFLILVFENEQSEILDAIDAGIPSENIIKITNL